jgi:hypothetical protein
LRHHRSDDDSVRLTVDPPQLVQILQIQQMRRPCQPQLHHWDQAVSAGDDPRLLAVLPQSAIASSTERGR